MHRDQDVNTHGGIAWKEKMGRKTNKSSTKGKKAIFKGEEKASTGLKKGEDQQKKKERGN